MAKKATTIDTMLRNLKGVRREIAEAQALLELARKMETDLEKAIEERAEGILGWEAEGVLSLQSVTGQEVETGMVLRLKPGVEADYMVPGNFYTISGVRGEYELNDLLSAALRAICLTRDYVGEETLPAIAGWEWYEAGKRLADHLQDEWADEFRKRVNRYRSLEVRKVFNPGDWVFGIGEHKGCSEVFEGAYCDYQPFSYLDDYDPNNYRLATVAEIEAAKAV